LFKVVKNTNILAIKIAFYSIWFKVDCRKAKNDNGYDP